MKPLRLATVALVLGALLAGAPSALAAPFPVVPIAATPVYPANGATYTANTIRIPFSARWAAPPHTSSLFVDVDNQNILGQDGTLADDAQYRVGGGSLTPGDADPSTWTGTATGSFTTPGTYYFQFHTTAANNDCGPEGGICTLASPVYSFKIAAPAPATPSASFTWRVSDAKAIVPRALRQATRRTPRALRRTCSRIDNAAFDCRVSWRDKFYIWAGNLSLSIDEDTFDVSYDFEGLRAKRSCVRRSTVRRCQRSVSF